MEVKGYYELVKDINKSHCSLTGCGHLPEGYLQVIGSVNCQMLKIQHKDHQPLTDANTNARLAYNNYCQDLKTWQYYGCSYNIYMTQIIDQLTQNDAEYELKYEQINDPDLRDTDIVHSPIDQESKANSKDLIIPKPHVNMSKRDRSLAKDFNYPDKTMGYLAQANTDFVFIGPDRRPIKLDSVDTLLKIASIVRSTGQPNYKHARIPIESGLNVEAWERHLRDYSDKRIIQYIKFGFPLSLIDPHELNDTKMTNHFSACQYPQQIQE